MMLKYLIQTSIFRYSKNYGSLTHETRIKDVVNMGDLICLLATVRTLNLFRNGGGGIPGALKYESDVQVPIPENENRGRSV